MTENTTPNKEVDSRKAQDEPTPAKVIWTLSQKIHSAINFLGILCIIYFGSMIACHRHQTSQDKLDKVNDELNGYLSTLNSLVVEKSYIVMVIYGRIDTIKFCHDSISHYAKVFEDIKKRIAACGNSTDSLIPIRDWVKIELKQIYRSYLKTTDTVENNQESLKDLITKSLRYSDSLDKIGKTNSDLQQKITQLEEEIKVELAGEIRFYRNGRMDDFASKVNEVRIDTCTFCSPGLNTQKIYWVLIDTNGEYANLFNNPPPPIMLDGSLCFSYFITPVRNSGKYPLNGTFDRKLKPTKYSIVVYDKEGNKIAEKAASFSLLNK